MTNTFVVIVFCLVSYAFANINYDSVESDVQLQCIQHCPLQNRTDLGHYDYACNYQCNIEQCSKGCNLWKDALSSSCQRVCNGTSDRLSHRELYCVMGCNDAIAKYFGQIRVLLGSPPAPALLDNSLAATSLKLEWRFLEAPRARLSCHVQWRYEEIAATWQYCRNATWNPTSKDFLVEGLQPYTKYRFRIALNLGHGHGDPIFSDQSVVIATLAAGIPASPPTHVRAAPVDAHSVSVNWEPGPFPHGPLLSYVLQITDQNPSEGHETRSEVKDVPATNSFYVYRNLQPNRNYTVSIQMRNSNGPGPAAIAQVSTPKEILISEHQQPILILGTQHGIFELESLFGDTLHLFHSDETTIQGISIHISKQLLFISDALGSVWRIPIEQETKNHTKILSTEQIDFFPLDVSVDWLNDQLYILGEVKPRKNQGRYLIKRCNLDGSGLTVALAGLTKKPIAMEIDPCNGYLFWAIRDYSTGGVYRLDISDISNGIKHEVKVEKILNEPNLGAFVIDYTNFRLFVPNQRINTMLAVSLDGKEVKNIRQNVVVAKLQNVSSLGTVNQKFYWTDGSTVYNEEYHQKFKAYYHNKISHLGKTQYKKILINLNSSQPWPIPLNPPTNLQAVFGNTLAKAKWLPPHLLGLQGKGAWQNWSYEISVKNLMTNITSTYETNTPSFSLSNLTGNTDYLLRVSAYSQSGKGPWSSEFKGSTMEKDENPSILWSGTEGLFKSDTAIESVETLIHKSRMRNTGFTGMSWYRDKIYMVTNSSHVYWYNLTSHKQGRLADMDSVGSIAVDWIGKKLYWSNLKQQLIIRCNLNGTQQEPLSILTLAKEISIDSVQAYLYWSREYVVESAHLNGEHKTEYDHLEPFSGKQVMGLTLDIHQKQVYWIVRGSDGSHLFRAPMAGYNGGKKIEKTRVALLQTGNMQGPLSYFSKRLLWLQDERNAVISDLEGKNMATVSGKSIWGLNLVYVADESLHSWPENLTISGEEINVIPEMVDINFVKVVGSAANFNITWKPITNVNYGIVFYEIQIDEVPRNNALNSTTEPTIRYWREVAPFTPLYVTIRAYTYWASSQPILAELLSPPSTPSAPRNLRTYVVYEHNNSLDGENFVSVTLRWDTPLYPNGVLQGYKVRCWYMENEIEMDICDNAKKAANETEYVISELSENEIYFFQVQAFTEIGTGTISPPISVHSSYEAPLPTLLIASTDSIFIDDIDTNHNYSLLNGINTPLEITYLMRENKIFWVNEMQELLMYHFHSANKTKIFDLKESPKGIALDWLERSLYYVEETNESFGSAVYKINLNQLDKNIIKSTEVFATSVDISKIEVSPYTKKIYWLQTVDADQTYKAMYSNLDGTEIQEFFKPHNRKRRNIFDRSFGDSSEECNCPYGMNLESTFTIDHSVVNKPQLIFVDSEFRDVFSSDKDGCFCKVIANNSIISNTFPLQRIKSDFGSLYWTSTDGILYALKRKEANLLSKPIKAKDVIIYGKHMQPYPPKECLSPKQHANFTPTIKKKSYNHLTLKMPEVVFKADCLNTSTPTLMYTISCKELMHPEEPPYQVTTFKKVFEMTDLKPFTRYAIRVAVSNHFTKDDQIVFGEPINLKTSPGAPSKPQNISASVLHPTLAQVNWLPPEELNGEIVHYEIHWLTEGSLTGLRQKGEQAVSDLKTLDNSTNVLTNLLKKLSPNETYTIWIRAYSETNETSSDSDRVQITTYPEPAAFELVNKTSQTLSLMWKVTPHIQEYVVEYAPITSTNTWVQANGGETKEDLVEIVVKELKPKTQYKFRLSLLYDKYPEWYIWPSDSRFTFETLGDRPSPPGTPGIQFFGSNVYKVVWEASQDNGAPIELYSLESLKLRSFRSKRSTANNRTAWFYSAPSIEEEEFYWEQVFNGTENSWIITDLDEKYKYAFRVSALNAYGWSDPSAESTEFDISEAERMSQKNPMNLIFIATFVPLSICVTIVLCFSYMTYSRKCGKQKKIEHIVAVQRGPDVELATLRELPRRGVHSTNILYVSAAPNSEDITMLPHIRRDQITLTKFLGSGAFGEVFEGKAKGLCIEAPESKVAVKTLKKGASEQEKSEFLQEAQLMSHFKHEHILQLLGVCLDNDPQFIIMELMEGGDLLTYLRDSRSRLTNFLQASAREITNQREATIPVGPFDIDWSVFSDPERIIMSKKQLNTQRKPAWFSTLSEQLGKYIKLLNNTPSLTLIELLKMCLDVTKGCRYLEEMHFVHRDLACRNCLVSSVESENRIVKIGDFGLARDIYKNDYYRKEGEGLLPVRWMAPESLLDGVFTCQSDVWAFGVLLWEIMTLGQQPYQARSNLEVLHYVRGGGRLGKPRDCPEDLYKLMLKCWEFEPDKRPTFKYCLEVLDYAHREHLRNPSTAAHSQYISTVPDLFAGISNAAYFLDENENSSGMSWKSENEDDGSKEQTPFLPSEVSEAPKEIPKYLELLYEPEQEQTPLENDGYEIPNHMLPQEELASPSSPKSEITQIDNDDNQQNNDSNDESKIENIEVAYSNIQS